MTDPVAQVVSALTRPLAPLDDAVAALGRDPGLVAWWGTGLDLEHPRHPTDPTFVLLEVGAATMLRNRVTRQDLYRTGVSTLRRALAGLLLDALDLAPTWAADVVLPRADEDRLTAWMRAHLRLSATVHPDRAVLLPDVVAATAPALRPDHEPARSALARFTAAAGPRPTRDPSVPFRRP